LLVFGCIIAFFMAGWVGAGMLFWVCLYSSKVIDRHEEKIRTEIRKARPE
jgi:membrane protein DedA with SNARE-associated domain